MIRVVKSDGTRLKIRKNGALYIARLFNSIYKTIVSLFKARVLADAGIFEAETYLESKLGMFTQDLFSNASYIISPNGYKTSKIYALKPNNGTGDLNVVRNTTATRINQYGIIETVPANVARIDYSKGKPCFLIERQRTNLVYPSNVGSTQVRAVTAVVHTLSFYGTGSVTLSGAFSGSLVGTGANNRVSLTFTPTAGNLTLTVSGTVTDWQLEAGSNATSLIKTTSGSVTRNADDINKSGISSLIGQTEGSIFCEFERTTELAGNKHLLTLYAEAVNTTYLHITTATNSLNLIVRVSFNSNTYQYGFKPINGKNKILVTYDSTGCDIYLNAFKLPKLVLPSFPSLYNLQLMSYDRGRQYGSAYIFSFWKIKLTDQQALQLTAL